MKKKLENKTKTEMGVTKWKYGAPAPSFGIENGSLDGCHWSLIAIP